MTVEPLGTWLCPSCSPNAAFYIKQLVKTQAASSVTSRLGEAATATSSKGKEPKSEAKKEKVVKKGVAVKKPAPKKLKARNAGWVEISEEEEEELTPKLPASSKGKGKEDRPEANNKLTAKKGIAVKKPVPETSKPKWKGWQELPSDDEEEFKKQVEAKWTEDIVEGKRTRTSKALAEEPSRGPRRFRGPSGAGETKNEVNNESDQGEDTDDGHSVYQQEEQKEEEAKDDEELEEEENSSIDDASSDSHEDSDDSMDVDEPTDHSEDWDGSMDMDLDQDDSVEASSSSSRLSVLSLDSGAAESSSLPQELPSATSPAGPSAESPQEYIIISDDDDMDVEVQDEAQDHQGRGFGPVAHAVERNNHAALYPQRGNGWGYFRESAIRSTLPRLG